jgi:hypothetical protein
VDAVGIVNQAIQDGIGDRGVANVFVPVFDMCTRKFKKIGFFPISELLRIQMSVLKFCNRDFDCLPLFSS